MALPGLRPGELKIKVLSAAILLGALRVNTLLTKAELQMNRGTMENSEIIFLISNQNIRCEHSLELSLRDGSNEGSQCILCKIKEKYPLIIPVKSSYLEH